MDGTSLTYDLATEFCVPADATTASFAFQNSLWPLTNLAQMTIVAYVSTIFNVGVLLFHWTTAPHPKFLMRAPRNLSIRMHVLSGTVEILAWSLSWFWGVDSNMGVRTTLTQIQVVASFVHAGTAAYQTPIVFGTQAVMVPAYVLCVAAKIWCGVDLWLNTACLRKSVRLYNVLSIYTWCRVFIGLFGRTLMFQDSLYSVSILFAGAVCLPSLGVGAMGAAFLAIAIYQMVVWNYASDTFRAQQFSEHGRDLFDNGAFDQMIAASSGCPAANLGGMDHQTKMRHIFDSVDTDRDGTISKQELQEFAEHGRSTSWLQSLEAHQKLTGKDHLTYGKSTTTYRSKCFDMLAPRTLLTYCRGITEDFCKVLGSRASVSEDLHGVAITDVLAPGATYDQKARFLFDKINNSAGMQETGDATPDSISAQDLGFVLMNYGVPASEAHHAMRKYDGSKDGMLSFEEFKAGFGPLIRFQISELKGRVKEHRRKQQRIDLQRLASHHQMAEAANDPGHSISATVDEMMDAGASAVGDLGKGVASLITLADDGAAVPQGEAKTILPNSPATEQQIGV